MSGDVHVRFCERLRGRFPGATRPNVYVRSERAGERVMALLRKLYGKLRLKLNESKSAVARVFGRKYLGYNFWIGPGGEVKCGVHAKALKAFKHRVRQLTRGTIGSALEAVIEKLNGYLRGWKGYFQLSQTPRVWQRLDGWIRRRLRSLQLKQWKTGKTIYRRLRALGVGERLVKQVASHSRSWWYNSQSHVHKALPNAYFDRLGLIRLS